MVPLRPWIVIMHPSEFRHNDDNNNTVYKESEIALAAPEDDWSFCLQDLRCVYVRARHRRDRCLLYKHSIKRLVLWHHKGATGRRRHQNKKERDLTGTLRFTGAAGGFFGDVWLSGRYSRGWRDAHLHPDRHLTLRPPQTGPQTWGGGGTSALKKKKKQQSDVNYAVGRFLYSQYFFN